MFDLLLLSSLALAQSEPTNPTVAQERPAPPAASMSASNTAMTSWVNPALMGYDPDPAFGMYFRQTFGQQANSAFTLATSVGGGGVGVQYKTDLDGNPWWGLNAAMSVRLPQRLRLGANLQWSLPDGKSNFTSWDIGLGWRPLPWLGLGGVARNIGNPNPDLYVWSRYGASVTLRPFNEKVEFSVDYENIDNSATDVLGADNLNNLAAILRVRPVDGLVLSARGDTNVAFSQFFVGGGLEVYFGGLGGGVYTTPQDDMATMAYFQTAENDERVFGVGKQVPVVNLNRPYPYIPQDVLFGSTAESYVHLLERLRKAADDKHVKGMLLEVSGPRLSWAQVDELRAAVQAIQAQGKPVVAYLGGAPSNGAYYLATTCDKIYLHPAGNLDLVGLSMEAQFFRGALDLVGVEAQYAKRSEYKASPEQWTNTEPSDPAREQMNALLDDLYDALVDAIAVGRGFEREAVRGLIDGGPYTANEALELGLVDKLLYPDQLEEELEDIFPKGYDLDADYRMYPDTNGWRQPKQIAVIYIAGPITGGESGSGGGLLGGGGNTGSATVVRQLRQAREDNAVKAVVLRVDSPGGSAFASDEIWRAVELLKAEGKPVIVSFGGVAASGGYYVAAGADAIYASPTTITGSIGVYGGKFSFGDLYEKLGVSYELYTRGRKAGMYSMSRPMDDIELASMERMIDDTYLQFKTRVADGRGMTMDEVEQVARGRVWSGIDAHGNGLVDEMGGFQTAVARAKAEAGMGPNSDVELISYNGQSDSFGDMPKTAANLVRATIAPELQLPDEVARWLPYAPLADEKVLLLMPYQIEVK